MFNFAFPLFVLGMAASVATAPAPGTSTGTVFSFAAWADDIFANPDTALTPEEAVASAEAADVVGSAGGLTKRVICQDLFKNAPAKDAAACVDDLARKGRNGVNCVVRENEFAIQQRRIGGVQITSTKSDSSRQSVNCNEVARTAGLIFDSCFRADNTVKGSEIISSNRKLQVNIRHA